MPESFTSLKGQLLLDSGQLRGSFFNRSVVLICQHDADGAFGLVLNQPLPDKVGDVLVVDLPDLVKEQPLFNGGPVQPGAFSYLHSDLYLPEASVMPGLHLGLSLDDLADAAQGFSADKNIRCFAGYSGWSPGQLESEMKRNAWLTHPASADLIFKTDPSRLWQEILRKKGWEYRILAQGPEDISWN